MKPERNLVAARTVARHCSELFGAEPDAQALTMFATRFGELVRRSLAPEIERISGGAPAVIQFEVSQEAYFSDISEITENYALHVLFSVGSSQQNALVSIAGAPILRMLDRTFGGSGELPDPLPKKLPQSGMLLADRIQATLASTIQFSLSAMLGTEVAFAPIRRDTSLQQLAPFPLTEKLLQIRILVEDGDASEYALSLAFPLKYLAALATPSRAFPLSREALAIDAEPLATLPVTLSATIVETTIPITSLAALKPGDVLPVAIASRVPIRAGKLTIAHGVVGDIDDRVALQIVSPSS